MAILASEPQIVIAGIILGVVAVAMTVALVRALITGEINAVGNGSLVSVSRSKEPAAFWTSFIIGVLAVAFAVWLLIP